MTIMLNVKVGGDNNTFSYGNSIHWWIHHFYIYFNFEKGLLLRKIENANFPEYIVKDFRIPFYETSNPSMF